MLLKQLRFFFVELMKCRTVELLGNLLQNTLNSPVVQGDASSSTKKRQIQAALGGQYLTPHFPMTKFAIVRLVRSESTP